MSERAKNPDCLLGKWPDERTSGCNPLDCCRCGWNPEVEKKRKEMVREKYAVKGVRRK